MDINSGRHCVTFEDLFEGWSHSVYSQHHQMNGDIPQKCFSQQGQDSIKPFTFKHVMGQESFIFCVFITYKVYPDLGGSYN